MPAFRRVASSLLFALVLAACGSSSSSGGGASREGGAGAATGSGGAGSGMPTCDATCPGVLAAKCSGGPVDQADCVSGCQTVRAGACAAKYEALYACGGATPAYSCTSSGQVAIVGCDAQTTALWSCLAGGG